MSNFKHIIEDSHIDSFKCERCGEILRFTYTAKPEAVNEAIDCHVCKQATRTHTGS